MAEQATPAGKTDQQPMQPADKAQSAGGAEPQAQSSAQTPQSQSPGVTPSQSPVQQQKKKNVLWLILLIIIFLILVFIAALWYIWQYTDIVIPYLLPRSDSGSGAGEEEETDTADAEEDEVTTETFTGEYLTGEIPEDWTLVEYIDGENMDYLSSGTSYSGLTGFGIKDDTDTELYRVDAAYGIGGISYCEEYFQFDDDSAAYYNEAVQTNQEVGEAAPTIVDLIGEEYEEYEIMGVKVRRVGPDLYWDAVDGDAYFQANCYALSSNTLPYQGLSFDADGGSTETYLTKLPINTDDEEKLELLDAVLQSLELMP